MKTTSPIPKIDNDKSIGYSFSDEIESVEPSGTKPVQFGVPEHQFEATKEWFFNSSVYNREQPSFIQPKLKIGSPNDKYEQEADRMADLVVQQLAHGRSKKHPKIQRQVQGTRTNASDSGSVVPSAIAQKLHQSKGQGKSLSPRLQSQLEEPFGENFSRVRIHTGEGAIQLNRQLRARAFTYGSDVYFNQGEFQPSSTSGLRLLAHELTHVVQQGYGSQNIVQRQGTDTDPDLYIKGDNKFFENQGQARIAAEAKLSELSLANGPDYRIEHHPLPTRGLPHYHVFHISRSKQNYRGHFFYRTKKRRRQYKVDWRSVYNVVMFLGLSLSLIAVIIAALVDPEPASKLALAGLSIVMIGQIMNMLDSENGGNDQA